MNFKNQKTRKEKTLKNQFNALLKTGKYLLRYIFAASVLLMLFASQNFVNAQSSVRWFINVSRGMAFNMAISGNGLVGYCGWAVNNKRVSAYGNSGSTPFWDYNTSTSADNNYVSASDTGIVAAGSYHNIYLFNKNSNAPFFNFNLTTLPDTGTAGPIGITSDGAYLIGTAIRSDTSTILGFSKDSNVPVWKLRVRTRIGALKISDNDSLAIINTAYNYWVVNVYTGAIRYRDTILYKSYSNQGISRDGSYIVTVDNRGYVRVSQWNGTTYNLLWQYQEPHGSLYNRITAVDISSDGSYIASGTATFIPSGSSYTYDGTLRFFKTANGNTPVWSRTEFGDEVSCINFSKNGKILAVTSWGDTSNTVNDFYVFKTSFLSNVPIFSLNMPGSPVVCSVSNDGTSIIAGGKNVHMRNSGYGGIYYNIHIDTSDNPLKINNLSSSAPNSYELRQNFPNPFNPTTIISFDVPKPGMVKLKVYNVLGTEIATLVNEVKSAGSYDVEFKGANLTSGVYFYKLEANGFTDVKRMMLIK